jgi:hypothetical protein
VDVPSSPVHVSLSIGEFMCKVVNLVGRGNGRHRGRKLGVAVVFRVKVRVKSDGRRIVIARS